MKQNETEFANQDEEISYKDMWLSLRKDLAREVLEWEGLDCVALSTLREVLAKMNALENKARFKEIYVGRIDK